MKCPIDHLAALIGTEFLTDFEDVETEKKTLDHAQRSGNLIHALPFSCLVARLGPSGERVGGYKSV